MAIQKPSVRFGSAAGDEMVVEVFDLGLNDLVVCRFCGEPALEYEFASGGLFRFYAMEKRRQKCPINEILGKGED